MRVCAVYFLSLEGWTPRNGAVMEVLVKLARATRHPWLMACDANLNPEYFKNKFSFNDRCMCVEASG